MIERTLRTAYATLVVMGTIAGAIGSWVAIGETTGLIPTPAEIIVEVTLDDRLIEAAEKYLDE